MERYEELTPEETERIKSVFPEHDWVRFRPSNCLMTRTFGQQAEKLYNMEVREDDVWILTYPKVGTTWTQEMVWQIVNNVDLEGGKMPLFGRTPFLEAGMLMPPRKDGKRPQLPPGTPQEVK